MCGEELDKEEERLEELTKIGDEEALIALLYLLYRRHNLQKYCDIYNTYGRERPIFSNTPIKLVLI